MAKLGKLFSQGVGNIGDIFCKQLDEYIVKYEEAHNMNHGSNFYKPSGIDSCERSLYYHRCEVEGKEDASQEMISICANGTWRHETIQNYIEDMSKEGYGGIEWLDVGEYVKENNLEETLGTEVVKKVGNETKLFNSKYQMSFMCDGLIKFRGKLYILEIKTCAGFIFNKLDDVLDKHKRQAACYSMCLGVDEVVFLYEDRGLLAHKGFLYTISSSDKLFIADKIANIEEYMARKELPSPDKTKCKYCKYKQECRKNYNPLVISKGENKL